MKRYTILNITKDIIGTRHVYSAQRNVNNILTGNYICTTQRGENNNVKILSDFICMPHTYISSVLDLNRGRNLTFNIGEQTQNGTITDFKPENSNLRVYFGNGANCLLSEVQKAVVAPAAATERAATTETKNNLVTPSRSTQNNDIMDLQKLIIKSDKGRELRLEGFLKKRLPKTLSEFLVNFFKDYNLNIATIYVDTKEVQTDEARRRSLGDIFKICKYYYPECTLKEVLQELYVNLPLVIKKGFRTSTCNTIKKRVWYYDPTQENSVHNTGTNDEYNNKIDFYTSKL